MNSHIIENIHDHLIFFIKENESLKEENKLLNKKHKNDMEKLIKINNGNEKTSISPA